MTRGERNNNPGNIERNYVLWQGMDMTGSDPRFVTFLTPEYGIRAMGKLLLTYRRKYQLNTVRTMIERWAPAEENDSLAYANHVAKMLSVDPDQAIDPGKREVLRQLIIAIITHENGRCIYDDATIDKGVDAALA